MQSDLVNLKVQYITEKENFIEKILSRPVCEVSPFEVFNTVAADIPVRSSREMHEVQLKDDNLRKILEKKFLNPRRKLKNSDRNDRISLNHGVLYRYVPDDHQSTK
ncbi:hypothetical protein TNCV_2380771 [Trichonephila clavipes]|nr:hypothetical protein TNCV_2380771 [Trichonephila clavipes]